MCVLCNTITFRGRKFIFGLQRYPQGIWVKFVYEAHRVKVRKAKNHEKSLFSQYKTLIGNDLGSIEDKTVKFACSM